MFMYGNIKLFLSKIMLGTTFAALSTFLFLSLLTQTSADSGFGIVNSGPKITNWGGIYGAYISSIFTVFLGYSAYLIPAFLLINGLRMLLGIKNSNVLLKFFILLLGVMLLCLVLTLNEINGGLIGDFLLRLIGVYFIQYLDFKIIFWIVSFFLTVLSFVLIYFSFGLKIHNILYKTLFFLKIFIYLGRFLLIFKYFLPTISAKSSSKKSQKKRADERAEPTIKKSIKPFNSNFSSRAFEEPGAQGARYILPSLSLLNSSNEKNTMTKELERKNSEFSSKLETILKEYGVEGKIINFKTGPVVTLYEFLPAAGVKTSKVVGLSEDIARAMSSLSARISSQPGKTSIGIEIPNPRRESVLLGDLIKDENFISNNNGLTLALGKNIDGEKKFTDLEKMPHLLIAGTTGSGKSVGINSMIISLLYRFTPSECKLILIDPKMLELSIYENIPHLLTPVVTNPHKAIFALKWVVREMENRYKLMTSINVKNIRSFNAKILSTKSLGRKLFREVQTGVDPDTRLPIIEKKELPLEKMPLIVVVIDEMADLMMIAGKEVENLVQRLAQMARASGIHLIAATQRPSVDVITGTIKANFPSRISFRVASRFDSRTILNEMGAEQLLGSGDMLFLENGAYVTRLHGGFVSESEIEAVVNFIKSQKTNEIQHDITVEKTNIEKSSYDLGFSSNNVDTLYDKALTLVLEQQRVSTSFIQRYLQIGYNRAARIVEKMEEDGFISEPSHAGKRSVLKKNK